LNDKQEDSSGPVTHSDILDIYKANSVEILRISELEHLMLPDDKITFYTPNMLSSFHRVRSIASTIIGLQSAIANPSINEVELISNATIHCGLASGIGRKKLANDYNASFQDIDAGFDVADLIEVGVIELRENEPEKYIDINIATLFCVYALSSLVHFEQFFLESGRTQKEQTLKKETDASHETLVTANGSLLSGLLGLEKATRYYIKSVGEADAKETESAVLSKIRKQAINQRHKNDSKKRRAYIIKLLKSGKWANRSAFVDKNMETYLSECNAKKWPQVISNAPKYMKEVVKAHIEKHPLDSIHLQK